MSYIGKVYFEVKASYDLETIINQGGRMTIDLSNPNDKDRIIAAIASKIESSLDDKSINQHAAEILDEFIVRTNHHIWLVGQCGKILEEVVAKYGQPVDMFRTNCEFHDYDKLHESNILPIYALWCHYLYFHKKKVTYKIDAQKIEKEFEEIAWPLHHKKNKHHVAEHYGQKHHSATIDVPETNDILSICEMFADWMAMGIAIDNSAEEWFRKTSSQKKWKFHGRDLEVIEACIETERRASNQIAYLRQYKDVEPSWVPPTETTTYEDADPTDINTINQGIENFFNYTSNEDLGLKRDDLFIGPIDPTIIDPEKMMKLAEYPAYLLALKKWTTTPNHDLAPELMAFGKIIDDLYQFKNPIPCYRGIRTGFSTKPKQNLMGVIDDEIRYLRLLKPGFNKPGETFEFETPEPMSLARSPYIAKIYGNFIVKTEVPADAPKLVITPELSYLLQQMEVEYPELRPVNLSITHEVIVFTGVTLSFEIVSVFGDISSELETMSDRAFEALGNTKLNGVYFSIEPINDNNCRIQNFSEKSTKSFIDTYSEERFLPFLNTGIYRTIMTRAKPLYNLVGSNSWAHIQQVYTQGSKFVKKIENRTLTPVEYAALLFHDSSVKSDPSKEHHARKGAEIAKKTLADLFSEVELNEIYTAILEHDKEDNPEWKFTTNTSDLLASADANPPDADWILNKSWTWGIKHGLSPEERLNNVYNNPRVFYSSLPSEGGMVWPDYYAAYYKNEIDKLRKTLKSLTPETCLARIMAYRKKHHLSETDTSLPEPSVEMLKFYGDFANSKEKRIIKDLVNKYYDKTGSHGWNHISEVLATAEKLAKRTLTLVEYTAVVCHDLARKEMDEGHPARSVEIAKEILPGTNLFSTEELKEIYKAIGTHGNKHEFASELCELVACADRCFPKTTIEDLYERPILWMLEGSDKGKPTEKEYDVSDDLSIATRAVSQIKKWCGDIYDKAVKEDNLYTRTFKNDLKKTQDLANNTTPEQVVPVVKKLRSSFKDYSEESISESAEIVKNVPKIVYVATTSKSIGRIVCIDKKHAICAACKRTKDSNILSNYDNSSVSSSSVDISGYDSNKTSGVIRYKVKEITVYEIDTKELHGEFTYEGVEHKHILRYEGDVKDLKSNLKQIDHMTDVSVTIRYSPYEDQSVESMIDQNILTNSSEALAEKAIKDGLLYHGSCQKYDVLKPQPQKDVDDKRAISLSPYKRIASMFTVPVSEIGKGKYKRRMIKLEDWFEDRKDVDMYAPIKEVHIWHNMKDQPKIDKICKGYLYTIKAEEALADSSDNPKWKGPDEVLSYVKELHPIKVEETHIRLIAEYNPKKAGVNHDAIPIDKVGTEALDPQWSSPTAIHAHVTQDDIDHLKSLCGEYVYHGSSMKFSKITPTVRKDTPNDPCIAFTPLIGVAELFTIPESHLGKGLYSNKALRIQSWYEHTNDYDHFKQLNGVVEIHHNIKEYANKTFNHVGYIYCVKTSKIFDQLIPYNRWSRSMECWYFGKEVIPDKIITVNVRVKLVYDLDLVREKGGDAVLISDTASEALAPDTVYLIGSTNAGKLSEYSSIFGKLGIKFTNPSKVGGIPDVDENQSTYKGNAEKKAKEIAAAKKMYVLADDSGLSVDALNGEPGVMSGRYAGDSDHNSSANYKLVLKKLEGQKNRKAKYVTALSLADEHGVIKTVIGELHGTIAEEARGSNGFSYDVIFIPDGYNKTVAEMTNDEKNEISHRRKAITLMADYISKHMKAESSNEALAPDIKKKKQLITDYICSVCDIMDPSKLNSKRYHRLLDSMNDKEFDQWMNYVKEGKWKIHIVAPNLVVTLKNENSLRAADKVKCKLFHRLWMTDDSTGRQYLTDNEYLVLNLPVRRQQQFLDEKMSVPDNDRQIDGMTGQVTGDSKSSAVTNPEIQILAARGLDATLEELVNVRGGNIAAYSDFKRQAEETGEIKLNSLDPNTRSRVAVVGQVLLRSMMIENNIVE